MRDAAVGFQCPSCIKEGAKSTRSGRTAYGGQRSANPALTSQVLIAVNVAVWIAILATGAAASRLLDLLALRPQGFCQATGDQFYPDIHSSGVCDQVTGTWFPGVSPDAQWQLVSSMFVHVQPWHIGFNMLALWFLGPQLELAIGRVRFLALYLLSGLAGSALVYWAAPQLGTTAGASGAIFGLLGALLILVIKVRGDVRNILFWIGLNFVVTVVGRGFISWQGHLGGFLGGLALMAVVVYAPRGRRTAWQAAGFGTVALVITALLVLRSVTLG